MAGRFLARIVGLCARHAIAVALLAFLLGAGGVWLAAHRLGVTTDTDGLFSQALPWKQRQEALKATFPQNDDLLVAVIDAALPEAADATASALASALAADHAHFTAVRAPAASPWLRRNALLFLDPAPLRRLLDTTIDAEPFLGVLAARPDLVGLDDALGLIAQGAQLDAFDLQTFRPALARFDAALADAAAGRPHALSWERLLAGPLAELGGRFRFVLAKPVLDYSALEPGAAATQALRAAASRLAFVADGSAHVRITGPVALDDEEFASVAHGAIAGLAGSLVLVALWLYLAVRSARIILPILATLILGLVLTIGFAALAVGTLNLVSVAFAILFVGIAVDFAIQFSVRFRDRHHAMPETGPALVETGRRAGVQILVAAAATASGFLAFTPTSFEGVAELGLIAGVGMLIAFGCTLTVLPALLSLAHARGGATEAGLARLAPADQALACHARPVLAGFGITALVAIALIPRLTFDSDPLHTKNPDTEAMRTLAALSADPQTDPYTAEMLVPSLADARALAHRLERLPLVASVTTLATFVPDDQTEKLALIADAAGLLRPVLDPPPPPPPPDPAAIRASLRALSAKLGQAAAHLPQDGLFASLARSAAHLADTSDPNLEATQRKLTGFLPTQLDLLRDALSARRVTERDVPEDIRRDWLLPDGRAHVEVAPLRSAQSGPGLHRFFDEVRSVDPAASGSAATIVMSAQTITASFRAAALFALVAITLILAATLRRPLDLALVLAPLVLSALLTAFACVALPLPFNFANIIALPLLLGVGVSFNIYFVMNWRAGEDRPLTSAAARAVLFSALTTGTAFGSLALSGHPGTASMGRLLLLSLACTLVGTFGFLPALLAVATRYRKRGA